MSVVAAVLMMGIVTSVTCALPGVFLVVRGQSMIADAMSHGMLPGIVLSAWVVGSVDSPLLIIGAALMGLLIVVASEALRHTGLVNADATVGMFFPALFSIGVVMLSTIFKDVHLHEDAVLEGDLNIASSLRLVVNGVDYGPKYFWVMVVVLLFNLVTLGLLWRPLVASTFDPQLAALQGLPVKIINYLLMFVLSITITAAFKMAGAVLVVAFLIVPAATARLLVQRMSHLLILTLVIALVEAVGGFYLALWFDLATSATLAAVDGVIFIAVFFVTRVLANYRRGRDCSGASLSMQACCRRTCC